MPSVIVQERTESAGLTIQEMSRQCGLSAYTLRYYERIGKENRRLAARLK